MSEPAPRPDRIGRVKRLRGAFEDYLETLQTRFGDMQAS